MREKLTTLLIILVVGFVFALGFFQHWAEAAQQVPCYGQQGGNKQTAGTGCEYEFQSGSVLDVQAGSTVTFGSGVLDGSNVYQAATPGIVCNKKQTTITDTVTYTSTVTAITTPSWASCSLNVLTADAEHCSVAVGTPGAVVVLVRNSAVTPAANAAGALVNWEVCGTN